MLFNLYFFSELGCISKFAALNYYDFDFLMVFYNKYKFVEYYYYVLANLYIVYKFFKNAAVLMHLSMLKLYIIFINDTAFFRFTNFLMFLFFDFKKKVRHNFNHYNIGYLKLRKKYKAYYRLGYMGNFKLFVFLGAFFIFVLV